MFSSRSKQFAARIALFAFLYAAATPLFAGLRAHAQPEYLGALCTMGSVKIASSQPGVPLESGTSHPLQCVFCVGGAWQPPLDGFLTVPVPVAPGLLAPAGYADAHRFLPAALQPLSPRAPPRLA